jgi:predicted PurR-regulated permease PerM
MPRLALRRFRERRGPRGIMPADVSQPRPARNSPILTLVVVTGVLYFAQVVLIPLALAVLLAFLLAPAVRRFERWGLPRALATVLVALMSFSVIGATAWVAGREALQLATSLPQYKDNIRAKIQSLRGSPGGALETASEAIKDLRSELENDPGAGPSGPDGGGPVSVQIQQPGVTPLQIMRELAGPLLAPLGIAGAVIVFTILMLLKREDMRDRVIRLMGRGQMNVTTQALGEAAQRVTRYLGAQLVVNTAYGVPVGLALHFLGIPNAALWGLLAILLRFVPYVGAWIAAAMPVMLAFAISDDWSLVLWTIAVFLALELVSNNIVEPWLYGASTGLSTLAVMVAAIFWTWLWGVVGLLLATPLTVCLSVMGRYIPQLRFLDILLGDEPGLSPAARFYQRLLALDHEEATELAEEHAARESLRSLFDRVLIPALVLAEEDRHRDELDERRQRFILDSMRRLIEELADTLNEMAGAESGERKALAIVSARDEADDLAALMLERALDPGVFRPLLLTHEQSSPEVLDRVAGEGASVVVISAVPPYAVMHTVFIVRRLRRRLPQVRIVVGIWGNAVSAKARERLAGVGVERIVNSMQEAIAALQEMVAPISTDMLVPRLPEGEEERLRTLADLELLDTPPEEAFDRITKELARIFDVPIALLTLVDRERQWWKAQTGLPKDLAAQGGTPRDVSLCGHVVGNQEMLVVEDLARDERFANNPLVRSRGLRFYAGAPLRMESGQVIGSLCIIDTRPRRLEPRDRQMLQLVADLAMSEAKRRKERLSAGAARPTAVADAHTRAPM